jgi:F-type H+-transporting ATPase subunit b
MYLAGTAGVIDINGTVIVELITFLLMMAILARWVYPEIVKQAEARQRAIAEQLREAGKARADAEAQLTEATARLDDARKTAQGVVDAASKSAELMRQEITKKAGEEAKRLTESARKDIEVERDRAIQSVRSEVAGLVIAATEKVIGETLDSDRHRQLIDRAIEEVAGDRG